MRLARLRQSLQYADSPAAGGVVQAVVSLLESSLYFLSVVYLFSRIRVAFPVRFRR